MEYIWMKIYLIINWLLKLDLFAEIAEFAPWRYQKHGTPCIQSFKLDKFAFSYANLNVHLFYTYNTN